MDKELREYFMNIDNACREINHLVNKIKDNVKSIDKLGRYIDEASYNEFISDMKTDVKMLKELNLLEFREMRK